LVASTNGAAAPRDVVAERFWCVHAVERQRRRCLERDQGDALRRQRLHGLAQQRCQRIAVTFGDGVADRRQRGDDRTDRERGMPFVIDRRDDAVILQLELLFERKPRQGTLLQDGERSEVFRRPPRRSAK